MPSPVEFIGAVVKSLVDKPDQVEARWVDADGGYVELKVPAEDRGKVIGRRGRTIQALRDLASSAFGEGGSVGVELLEEDRPPEQTPA
jgi:predicted RNA-binding protein YlqC (UPF0109 family)